MVRGRRWGPRGPGLSLIALGLVSGTAWAQPVPTSSTSTTSRRSCPHTYRGLVRDREDDRPIPAASVLRAEEVVSCDDAGECLLEGLCPGLHKVEVIADGYTSETATITVPAETEGIFRLLMARYDVVVHAHRGRTPLETVAKTAIEGRALELSRGEALGDAVEEAPGGRTIRTGNVVKPVLNAQSANRVVIINDGVRHEAHKWGLDHGPELDLFSAGKVEVVRGAQGVRYGPEAIGGVVIVSPTPYPALPGLEGSIGSVLISNGRQGALFGNVVGALPGALEGLFFRGQISARKAGSLSTPGYALDNTGVNELDFGAALAMRREGSSAELSFTRFGSELGVFTGQVATTLEQFEEILRAPQPPQVDLYRFEYALERPFQAVSHQTVKAAGTLELGPETELALTYAWQLNDRQEYDRVRSSTQNAAQKSFTLDTHTLELVGETRFADDLKATYGLLALVQSNAFEGAPFLPNFRRYAIGPFYRQEWVGDQLHLELGMRADFEYRRVVDRERVGGADGALIITPLDFQSFVASTTALWEPSETFNMRFELSSAARPPSVDELAIRGVSQGQPSYEQGNLELGLETAFHAGVAAGLLFDELAFELELYGDLIDGFIFRRAEVGEDGQQFVRQTITGAFPAFIYDQTNAGFLGFNGEVRITPWPWLNFRSQLSMVRAQDLTSGGYLPFIPGDLWRNRITVQAKTLGPLQASFLSVESSLAFRQTRFDLAQDFAPPPDTYHLLGLSAGTTFDALGPPIEVSLEVQNAFNTRYRNYLSRLRYYADEPGLSALLRLKVPFEVPFDSPTG
jgi:iron complex outermembrane receptor protein